MVIFLVLGAAGGSAFAQIPVTDAALISEQRISNGEKIAKAAAMVEQARALVRSATGARGMVDVFASAADRAAYQVMDSYRQASPSGPISTLPAGVLTDPAVIERRRRHVDDLEHARDVNGRLYTAIGQRVGAIEGLRRLVGSCSDTKCDTELANRIGAEQALLANDMQRFQVLKADQELAERARAQRGQDQLLQMGSRPPYTVSYRLLGAPVGAQQ